MSMTASELFEIVKDVPREAWPELTWDGVEWSNSRRDEDISARIAEHAFIGSMTASLPLGWVAGKCEGHSCKNGNDATHMVYNVTEEGEYVGDSLVAALAAACKEAA